MFQYIMMSDNEILARLHDLGWNPGTINDTNRKYGLALIYNAEMDQCMDEGDSGIDPQEIVEHSLHNDQRRKNNLTLSSCYIDIYF
jgi:hypothetical protein